MRVIGGLLRGRRLRAPTGRGVRPTADRVREAIFDLLGPGAPGTRVLDLFAGTGALGIEALSRGAERALFVEGDRAVLAVLDANLDRCGLRERSRVVRTEALVFLGHRGAEPAFDLVLLDPPYGQNLVPDVLCALSGGGWVAPDGRVMCEAEAALEPPAVVGGLELHRNRRYGAARVLEYLPCQVEKSQGS